jgi:hypothetical protein
MLRLLNISTTGDMMKVRITNPDIPVPDDQEFEVKAIIEAYVLEIGGEDHRVWTSDCTVVGDDES